MVLVVLDSADLDSNFRIENAIRKTLDQAHSADVRAEEISKNYKLPDHANEDTGTLEEKCEAIVKKLDLNLETFITGGDLAVFKPNDPRRPSGEIDSIC